jgi:hypothetical protein
MVGPKPPNNNNGLLRIRFTYQGISFKLTNLGKYDDVIAYNFAQNICDRIRRDINNDSFTPTNNGELTLDVVKCASLTHGSKSGIKTIWENYAGLINKIDVPDLF